MIFQQQHCRTAMFDLLSVSVHHFKKILAYPILLPRTIFSIPGPLDVPMNGSAGSPNRNSERRAIDESTRQYAWGTGQMAYDGRAMAWYVRSALRWRKPEQ